MSFRISNVNKIVALGMSLAATTTAIASTAQTDEHPTIRAMSGAIPIDHLDPKTTALLIIDFQNEYFSGKMPIPDGKKAMANAQRLIQFADKAKIPVFQIQHVAPPGSAVFASDGETVKFYPGMMPRPQDTVVQKKAVSVFADTEAFQGTELNEDMKKAGIKTIVIAGLMTHACVAGAARDAVPLGYQVVVASDASATRAITRADGQTIDAQSLHRAALAEIEDTFGDVMTTSQIIGLPLR